MCEAAADPQSGSGLKSQSRAAGLLQLFVLSPLSSGSSGSHRVRRSSTSAAAEGTVTGSISTSLF